MKNKKLMMLLMSCGLIIGLYGCGVDASENDVDSNVISNEEVSGTENTVVESSYYKDSLRLINAYADFIDVVYKPVMRSNVNETNREVILKATNDYILYSQKFNSKPVTYEDELLSKHIVDLKYNADRVAEYTLEYVFKKERVYQNLIKDNFKSVQAHMDTVTRIEKEYYQ